IAGNLQRFMDSGRADFTQIRLYQLHYLYLCSRFAVLAARAGKDSLVPAGLVDYLYTRVEQLWRLDPAGNWDGSTFPGGIRERTLWNIAHATSQLPLSYYRAIEDEDLFSFAVAADLPAYERITRITNARSDVVSDVLAVAR